MTPGQAAMWKVQAIINSRARAAREDTAWLADYAMNRIDRRTLRLMSPLSGSPWVDSRPMEEFQLFAWKVSRGW
jgi:hypothetical protein